MKRDEDKPFICYKSKWSMKIVSRHAEGWRYIIFWMLPFFAMIAINIWVRAVLDANGMNDLKIVAVVVPIFLIPTTFWTLALIHWSKSRSGIIDLDELFAMKREPDRTKRPKRR